jgi:hypothetical protein
MTSRHGFLALRHKSHAEARAAAPVGAFHSRDVQVAQAAPRQAYARFW